MNFKLKNFGKIANADIKLDGITVICGNNDTGKSTVGKALFAFFNSLVNYKDKIAIQKSNVLRSFIFNNFSSFTEYDDLVKFISSHNDEYSKDEIKQYIENHSGIKISNEKAESLAVSLNVPESDIINEYIFRYFSNVMNGQIKKADSQNRKCQVIAEFKDGKNVLNFTAEKCKIEQGCPILHNAYYINSPFALDCLNEHISFRYGISLMDRNVINAIQNAQAAINEDSMTNILDSVINKSDLDDVRKVLKKAYSGNTKITNGKYYYSDDGLDFDIRNISAGLKSFALIERMLETGVLKRKDVLILDEPEIHLHSEWQIIYAELIVILQKKFDLTILLVTHSFQFLESLNFFMKTYDITDRGNYYIPTKSDDGMVLADRDGNLNQIKKNLKSGAFTLADMQLKVLDSGDDNEEDYK